MKAKNFGHDTQHNAKIDQINSVEDPDHAVDADDDEEITDDDLREYLMDEGITITAQSLHDAQHELREQRRGKK